MSEMKYQDFVLSKIGWCVAVTLSLFLYVIYYVAFYSVLSSVPMHQNLHSAYQKDSVLEHLEIYVSAPIYVTNFQNSPLNVLIKNLSDDKVIEGIVVVKSTLPKAKTGLVFNEIPQKEYKIPFKLMPKASISESVDVKISDINSTVVLFRMEVIPQQFLPVDTSPSMMPTPISTPAVAVNATATLTPTVKNVLPTLTITPTQTPAPAYADSEQASDDNYIFTPIPVEWESQGFVWSEQFPKPPGSECVDNLSSQNQKLGNPRVLFCAVNYSYGAFAESTLNILLLPPWSSLSALVLAFAVVWLLEQIMPLEWLTALNNRDFFVWYDLVKYAVVLFFFSSILIVFTTMGIVFVFHNINNSVVIYFGFVAALVILSPIVAWLASRFFQKWVTILSWKPILEIVDDWVDFLNKKNYSLARKSVEEFCKTQDLPRFIPDPRKKLDIFLNKQPDVEYRDNGWVFTGRWVFTGSQKTRDIILQAMKPPVAPAASVAPETSAIPAAVISEIPAATVIPATSETPIAPDAPAISVVPEDSATPDTSVVRKNKKK